MDNEVSEVSQVENSTNAKTSRVHTSTANQIGTILWAISTVLFFFIFINFAGMWSAAASLTGGSSVGSVGNENQRDFHAADFCALSCAFCRNVFRF